MKDKVKKYIEEANKIIKELKENEGYSADERYGKHCRKDIK